PMTWLPGERGAARRDATCAALGERAALELRDRDDRDRQEPAASVAVLPDERPTASGTPSTRSSGHGPARGLAQGCRGGLPATDHTDAGPRWVQLDRVD